MLLRDELSGEIRINSKYAHLYSAEYDKHSLEGDSTPIIKKKALLTQDYLRRMTINLGQAMTILPPNCRYVEKLNKGNIVVIEEPPAYRTVRIRMDFSSEYNRLKEVGKIEEYGFDDTWASRGPSDRTFNLAFPYVIFILYMNQSNQLSAGQVFMRVARMIGLSDYLLKTPLTNISDNQYVCFGSNGGGHPTLNGGVEAAINNFWAAQFNTDYTYNYAAYKNTAGVSSYMEWHALSQRDPMFIYNVKWINIPMNIGQAVDEMKRQYNLAAPTDMRYQTLAQMFSRPLDTGKDIKPTKRSRKKQRLYFDVAEGTFLDDNFYVHVGDPFVIKNGKAVCHINSMISFMESGDVRYIRVEREDGRLIVHKLTRAFKKYLVDRVKDLRYETEGTLKNGVVVKEDDIVKITTSSGGSIYKKVVCIRRTQEGTHEAQMGDGFYILENTEAEIFDVGQPKYKDTVLKKGKEYIYCQYNEVPCFNASIVKFSGVNTDRRGNLNLELLHVDKNLRHGPYKIALNRSSSRIEILDKDNIKPLPQVFRIGRRLMTVRDHNGNPKKGLAFGTPFGVGYEGGYGGNSNASPDDIKKYLGE